MQGMLDVFPFTELAGPAATGQLPGRVLRHVNESKQGDFLIIGVQTVIVADLIAKSGERLAKTRELVT